METPNVVALTHRLRALGMADRAVDRAFRTFNVSKFEKVRAGDG
jgi:hypothetical protein